jgi:starch-binding outer membrane protein, SusD/RagB family
MKKRIYIIPFQLIVLSVFFVMITGCGDDFFNQKAGDRISPDKHYQSLVDAGVSLQGAIIPLQDALPNLIILDGVRSDAMEITGNADANLRSLNDHTAQSGNPYINPSAYYKTIVNINEVLANIDKITLLDRNFNALTLKAYKGALIGMRAWTYFTLARLYGKVAYLDGNLISLPDKLNEKVLNKEVIIDTLIHQLIPYIHDNSSGTSYEELRLEHYVNNKALLGELYLERKDYANAAKYLKLACESYLNESALLKVDRTYQNAAWSTIFLNAESASIENIAVMPYSSDEDQDNQLAYWIGHNYKYMVKPSAVLVDSFMMQVNAAGIKGDFWRGPGVTFTIDTLAKLPDNSYVTKPYITKYEIDKMDPSSSDIIISRAADIHLLLAEALNRLGDANSQKYALMLLDEGVNKENPKPDTYTRWANNLGIRGRVYLKPREVPTTLRDEAAMRYIEDLIIAERAMELAFEGKRWFDLVRVAERRNEPGFLADKVAAKFAGTSKYNDIRTRLTNPANWYLPFE